MHDDEMKQLLIDSLKNQKQNFDDLKKLFIVTIVAFTIIICTMLIGFFYYETHIEYETTTTTETREVYTDGDNSNASVVEGNQYNDSAQHTQN